MHWHRMFGGTPAEIGAGATAGLGIQGLTRNTCPGCNTVNLPSRSIKIFSEIDSGKPLFTSLQNDYIHTGRNPYKFDRFIARVCDGRWWGIIA
jgi:hypothetical protein